MKKLVGSALLFTLGFSVVNFENSEYALLRRDIEETIHTMDRLSLAGTTDHLEEAKYLTRDAIDFMNAPAGSKQDFRSARKSLACAIEDVIFHIQQTRQVPYSTTELNRLVAKRYPLAVLLLVKQNTEYALRDVDHMVSEISRLCVATKCHYDGIQKAQQLIRVENAIPLLSLKDSYPDLVRFSIELSILQTDRPSTKELDLKVSNVVEFLDVYQQTVSTVESNPSSALRHSTSSEDAVLNQSPQHFQTNLFEALVKNYKIRVRSNGSNDQSI